MGTPLSRVLDGGQAVAAVYVVDYLRSRDCWPVLPVLFLREDFGLWLLNNTHVNGAYGRDFVLSGLDELVRNGYITRSKLDLELTPAFVTLMQQYMQ